MAGTGVLIEYTLTGRIAELRIPLPAEPGRADGLWQQSCVEAFIALDDAAYLEFNFSPSGEWAAYRFDGYRAGMRNADLPAPQIGVQMEAGRLAIAVAIDLSALPRDHALPIGLSAVIEDADGDFSYWALAHPPEKPDFHDRTCFALELPAAV
jgi:hypothetical protein